MTYDIFLMNGKPAYDIHDPYFNGKAWRSDLTWAEVIKLLPEWADMPEPGTTSSATGSQS